MSEIVILQPHGGMGDLILSFPVINAFAEAYPESAILYIAPPGLQEVAAAHPHVREVIPLKHGWKATGSLASHFRKRKIAAACALWTTFRIAWLLRSAGVPIRIGQNGRILYSFLFTHRVDVRSARGDKESHWVECLLDYPRKLGINPLNKKISIQPSSDGFEKGEKLLKEAGVSLNDSIAVLHCGKGEDVLRRRWPISLFAKVADELNRAGFRVVFTGSKGEIPLVDRVLQEMNLKGTNFAGKTDFQTLAAILQKAQITICPDSGPMHLSAAVGTPVVAIFAMKKDFPKRWKPWGVESAIIRPDHFPCRSWCTKENCPDFLCYQKLSHRPIVEAAIDLANKKETRTAAT